MRYNKKYIDKMINDPFPPLLEDERIYFNVPYKTRDFAPFSHCGFDSKKKLWFTGSDNSYLYALVEIYEVNEVTSEKAKKLLNEKLNKD